MNDRKKIFIALGSIVLIFTLFIGSYVMRQNQQQEILTVSPIESSEDINETDTLPIAEYGTMVGDSSQVDEELPGVEDVGEYEVEDGDGSGMFGYPVAKLDALYEDAMANSDLHPFEKELIRLMVEKEGRTFEEALKEVRPGATVVEQPGTETPSGNQNTEKPSNNTTPTTPTTPTKPPKQETPKTNEGDYGGANFNNPDNRTEQQKKADEDAGNAFNGGLEGGPSDDSSHEPEL